MQDTLTSGTGPSAENETQDPRLTSLVGADELQKEGFTNETVNHGVDLPTLPEADQAPDPDAPSIETPQDVADVAKLSDHVVDLSAVEAGGAPTQPSVEKIIPLDESMKANLDASTSGDQATKLMEEINPAPGSIGEQVIHEALQEARENETGVLPSVEVIREEIARREQAAAKAAQKAAQDKEEHVGKIRAGLNKLFGKGEK